MLLLGVLLTVLLLGSCGGSTSYRLPGPADRPRPADLGEPMSRADGGTARLADYRGNVVLVNFFSSDCLPCLEELPMLSRLHRELSGEGFTVVGVSLDLQGALATQLVREHFGIPYPLLLATERMFRRETPFGPLPALPMSVLLDRQGAVAGWVLGLLDEDRLRAAVQHLVAEPGPGSLSLAGSVRAAE